MGQAMFEISIQMKVLSMWLGETAWKTEDLFWPMNDEQHLE